MGRTLKDRGRAIVAESQRDLRGEAVIDGVAPRKGMFLVNHARRRVYGRIVRVRRSGAVVWERLVGSCSVATPKRNGDTLKITTDPVSLHHSGASYADAIPEGYLVLSDARFAQQPKEEPMLATATLLEKLVNPSKETAVKTAKKTTAKKTTAKKTATVVAKTTKPDPSKRESEIQKAVKAFLRKSPKETCPATAAHIGEEVNGFKSMDRDARFKEVRPVMRAMARDGVLLRKKGKSPHNGRPAWLYSIA